MTESPREAVHRALREQLDSYAHGRLGDVESAAISAHLDDCAECRAELAEITPPAATSRPAGTAPLAPAASRTTLPSDPAGPDARHGTATTGDRDRRGGLWRPALGAVVAASLLAVGFGLGTRLAEPEQVVTTRPPVRTAPTTAPTTTPTTTPPPSRGPVEPLTVTTTGVTVTTAGLRPHPSGIVIELQGSGFAAGARYRAVVRSKAGRDLPAGEFLGTGQASLTCTLQAAVLREGASGFSILDAEGRPVVQSRFEPL